MGMPCGYLRTSRVPLAPSTHPCSAQLLLQSCELNVGARRARPREVLPRYGRGAMDAQLRVMDGDMKSQRVKMSMLFNVYELMAANTKYYKSINRGSYLLKILECE